MIYQIIFRFSVWKVFHAHQRKAPIIIVFKNVSSSISHKKIPDFILFVSSKFIYETILIKKNLGMLTLRRCKCFIN